MRIIFLGVHNKSHKKPLCSSTKSGKRIDKIAASFSEFDCVKMNLFNLNYMPKGSEWHIQKVKFFKRAELERDDILVTLGFEVHRALVGDERVICKMISVNHPSLMWQKMTPEEYINDTVSKIKKQLYGNNVLQHII